MSFLSNILPGSIFGHTMPWATQEPTPQKEVETALTDTVEENETAHPTEQTTSKVPLSDSIETGLNLLRVEQSLRLQKRAEGLHKQIEARHQTIKRIDELSALLASRALTRPDGKPNSDGSVDCHDPAIRSLITTLQNDGVNVPLPDRSLAQDERNNAVNSLINQRGLLSDEEREKAQEFQQCVTEHNSFFQMLISVAESLHRIIVKVGNGIGGRAAS